MGRPFSSSTGPFQQFFSISNPLSSMAARMRGLFCPALPWLLTPLSHFLQASRRCQRNQGKQCEQRRYQKQAWRRNHAHSAADLHFHSHPVDYLRGYGRACYHGDTDEENLLDSLKLASLLLRIQIFHPGRQRLEHKYVADACPEHASQQNYQGSATG